MKSLSIKSIESAAVLAFGIALLCGAAGAGELVGAAAQSGEEKEETPEGWHYEGGEGISYGEQPIICAELAVGVEARYLTYGLVDCKDPYYIFTPEVTLFDWVAVGADAYYAFTRYHEKADMRSRKGRCFEFDPYLKLTHEFSPEDYEWLPTKVKATLGYMYEYHRKQWENGPDTQYWWVKTSLPDLWLVPELWIERDTMRDDGTYVNLKLSHNIMLNEDKTIYFTPYIAQGFGNGQRVKGYLCHEGSDEALNHAGFMDTQIGLEFNWDICDNVNLWAYAAYSDYLLDRRMRESSREYELSGHCDDSYNFVGGVYVTFYF